jgi:hypothetical protein
MDHDYQAILTLGWDFENQYVSPLVKLKLQIVHHDFH